MVNIAGFSAASNGVVAASWAVLLVSMGYIGRAVLVGDRGSGMPSDLSRTQPATEAP